MKLQKLASIDLNCARYSVRTNLKFLSNATLLATIPSLLICFSASALELKGLKVDPAKTA